ncbi:hypothetical protein LZC95_49170 [Pendulispora brunnea]|uniref:PE-PGRS family protein n=1 Tax=Pendulispora brunnea TaxID=2905690 RepID=A0ABZ2K6U7_9BACT
MTTGKKLAASAIVGILAGAAVISSAQASGKIVGDGPSSAEQGDKFGCGGHDGGKCNGKCGSKNACKGVAFPLPH